MAHLKISIRNMLIFLLAVAAVLASVELLLRAPDRTAVDDTFLEQLSENDILLLMDLEKMSYKDLYSSTIFSNLIKDALNESEQTPLYSAAQYDGYPVISYMQNEDIYDEDTVNIVVIGDSFVWGQSSLNRNEIFWRLLETNLRAQGYNCRVYGVGMIGANAYDELKWLRDSTLVQDLDPDMVIFGYLYNDPDASETEDDIYKDANMISTGGDEDFLPGLKRILPNIHARLANYVTARTMYTSDGNYLQMDSLPPVLKGEVYDTFEREFVAPLDAFAAQADFPVLLMTLPLYADKAMQKALYAPLYRLFGQYTNVKFYDSLQAFYGGFVSKRHADNYSVNIADFHPGSATNFFYASYIESFLKKDYSALLGERRDADLNGEYIVINEAMPAGASPVLLSRTEKESVYRVTYPSLKRSRAGGYTAHTIPLDRYYLRLPLQTDYIKLSFAEATDLSEIEITGDGAQDVSLYYTRINESLGYDDHTLLPFGERNADGTVWADATRDRVTSICIHAACADNDGGSFQITIRR